MTTPTTHGIERGYISLNIVKGLSPHPFGSWVPSPNGEFIRYTDHAAALAASEARVKSLELELSAARPLFSYRYFKAKAEAAEQSLAALETAMDPRQWDRALSDAWHKSIPDTAAAFAALRAAAIAAQRQETGRGVPVGGED